MVQIALSMLAGRPRFLWMIIQSFRFPASHPGGFVSRFDIVLNMFSSMMVAADL